MKEHIEKLEGYIERLEKELQALKLAHETKEREEYEKQYKVVDEFFDESIKVETQLKILLDFAGWLFGNLDKGNEALLIQEYLESKSAKEVIKDISNLNQK